MKRLCGFVALTVSITLLGSAVADDAKKDARKRGGDPEAMFKKLDANGDGKLSKEEFSKMTERIAEKVGAEKAKAFAEGFFKKLDANGDGELSLEEVKKMAELRGKAGDVKKKRKKDNP